MRQKIQKHLNSHTKFQAWLFTDQSYHDETYRYKSLRKNNPFFAVCDKLDPLDLGSHIRICAV